MKILLISDSHLYNETLKKIIDHYPNMDYYIHCGDSSLKNNDPLLNNFIVVKGNHDQENFETCQSLKINKYNILITHGNSFNIYGGFEELYQYMIKNNFNVCFHGHTHVPNTQKYRDMIFINPGSTMINRGEFGYGSYAVVDIQESIEVTFYNSETFQKIDFKDIIAGRKILDEFKKICTKKQ